MGECHSVEPEALAALFTQFASSIDCVVLSACYSRPQAEAIAGSIEYVVGMGSSISDSAAIAYAVGFYQGLGAGRTIEDAHALGRAQVAMQSPSEVDIPMLVRRGS